jgi:hypothetical protein
LLVLLLELLDSPKPGRKWVGYSPGSVGGEEEEEEAGGGGGAASSIDF